MSWTSPSAATATLDSAGLAKQTLAHIIKKAANILNNKKTNRNLKTKSIENGALVNLTSFEIEIYHQKLHIVAKLTVVHSARSWRRLVWLWVGWNSLYIYATRWLLVEVTFLKHQHCYTFTVTARLFFYFFGFFLRQPWIWRPSGTH